MMLNIPVMIWQLFDFGTIISGQVLHQSPITRKSDGLSCFHFREKDSLSRAKSQTLLQENMISNSHSTPGRNRSSRKRVSKIDVRRLNVSTFVFFFQFQHILLQRPVLPHSTQTTICQKPTRTSQAQQKTSFKRGPSCSTI